MSHEPNKEDEVQPAADQEESPVPSDDVISQQDQNAQLFIEALLQASQNQLLTESALLAMNQLWMGARGNLALSGQGNISLGGSGNISLSCQNNEQFSSHGNAQSGSRGNEGLGSHGNERLRCHGNEQLQFHGNQLLSSHGNSSFVDAMKDSKVSTNQFTQHVSKNISHSSQNATTPGSETTTNQVTKTKQSKDIHIIKALSTSVNSAHYGQAPCSQDSQAMVAKVKSEVIQPGSRVTDVMDTDYAMAETALGLSSSTSVTHSTTAQISVVTVPVCMDTTEVAHVTLQNTPDSVDMCPAVESTSNQMIKQSTSPVSVSPKKKSRRLTGSTSSQMSEGSSEPAGVAVKGQAGLEKGGSENRAATPRRRGSNVYEGGRRSRTHSECEGEITPDPTSLIYSSDDLRRQMTGSVTPDTDVGFQPSMLDAVLTEKKLALLRSPEVRQFLHQQQMQRAKEKKLTHSSRAASTKGDNPS